MKDQHVDYGAPLAVSDEHFLVRAVTHDSENRPLGVRAYVLLRDERSGAEWRLDIKQARRLTNAIRYASNVL